MNQQYRIPFQAGQPGPVAKILAAIAAAVLLVASFFLGIVFLGAAILFVLVFAIMARFGRPATPDRQQRSQHGSTLEGEYVVVEKNRSRDAEG